MDAISTSLTNAWLDAVRRAQSEFVQRLQEVAPQTRPSRDARTLTDVLEAVVVHGGAAPDQATRLGPVEPAPSSTPPTPSTRLVDRLA